MKLVDICSILIESDELKRGWTKGDEYTGDELEATVGSFKLGYNIYQETINSPTRHYRDSPPEGETYLGDVTRVVINSLVETDSGFDFPDLDFGVDAKNLGNPNLPVDLLNHLNDVSESFDVGDKKVAKNVLAHLQSNGVLKEMFKIIVENCNSAYKGEI